MKTIIGLLVFVFSSVGFASVPNFDVLCSSLLQKDPSLSNYADVFTEDFRKAVSFETLKAVFASVYSEVGRCVSYSTIEKAPHRYTLTAVGERKLSVQFSLVYDPLQHRLSGLLVGRIEDPSIQIHTWKDLEETLARLDPSGRLAATLKTADGSLTLQHNAGEVFAIGSTFKLYVLGALHETIARGDHTWDEVLPIREEWKSLPSGVMHTWPAGQEVKLYKYAENMISLSDNTATDHLLSLLGRDKVEAMLAPMGNSHESDYFPFLSTLEMFKLKWAIPPSETAKYLLQDVSARRATLERLKTVPREAVGTNGVDGDTPTLIDRLEWFATTNENCEAMFWLASKNSPQIRTILAKSVPVLDPVNTPESHWAYAGYKGGSEPGVLSMTVLVESKIGKRACLSMSWNNPSKTVSASRMLDVMKKTLAFAETQIP